MKTRILVVALVSSLALSACGQNGPGYFWGLGPQQPVRANTTTPAPGTPPGAVAGGAAGAQAGGGSGGKLWATGSGALLGAFGSPIAKSLDQADMAYHEQAVEQAETGPLNKTIAWNNADSGHSGSVTPIREGHVEGTGQLCRQYNQTITVNSKTETAAPATACQNPDSTWTLEN